MTSAASLQPATAPGRPPKTSTVRHRDPEAWRCDVSASAVMRGVQDIRVTATSYLATGTGIGVIAVRVGRVLVYVEDRDSLRAGLEAWQQAAALAESAFGPLCNRRKAEAAARLRRDGGNPPR